MAHNTGLSPVFIRGAFPAGLFVDRFWPLGESGGGIPLDGAVVNMSVTWLGMRA
jgi:hypothetical protein